MQYCDGVYKSPSSTTYECDCYICQAGQDCRYVRPSPFYPAMCQPLVYYADVPNKRGKKKPNCFKRAFHWYTDDLHPERMQEQHPTHLGAFASWLDEKYEQFLQEHPNSCGVKLTQTSVMEACVPFTQRAKQSMEYILPPKDLTRAASEGYRATPTSCHSVQQQRYVIKSQSLTSIEKEMTDDDKTKKPVKFDNPPVEKKSYIIPCRPQIKEIKQEVTITDKSCQCYKNKRDAQTQYEIVSCCPGDSSSPKQLSETKNKTSKEVRQQSARLNSKTNDMSCECTTTAQSNVTVQTVKLQSPQTSQQASASQQPITPEKPAMPEKPQKTVTAPPPPPPPPPPSLSPSTPARYTCLQCRCPNCYDLSVKYSGLYTSLCDTQTIQSQFTASASHQAQAQVSQEVVGKCSQNCPHMRRCCVYRNVSSECVGYVEICAQTSDHAINLEKAVNTIHGYPLYLKILCADKLSQ